MIMISVMMALFIAHQHIANGDQNGQQRKKCYFQMRRHGLLVCLPFSVQLYRSLLRMAVTVIAVAVIIVLGFVVVCFGVGIRVLAFAHEFNIINYEL